MEAYGIPLARCVSATSLDHAIAGAEKIGFPVVLKIKSHGISHKTEVGVVGFAIKDKSTLTIPMMTY